MNEKGIIGVLALITLVIVSISVFFIFKFSKPANLSSTSTTNQAQSAPQITDTYTDELLTFNYPSVFQQMTEDEEEYFKREGGDFRKNFTSYVQYSPPIFYKAIIIKDKKPLVDTFDLSPLVMWVFENPSDLTPKTWYNKYWYYPLIWGKFSGKGEIAPTKTASISGQIVDFAQVDYQPGKPKFYLIKNQDKMFLFRIIDDSQSNNSGFQIFSTLNFK